MQLGQLFRQTVERLRQAGIEEPESDAFHLFSCCFGLSRSECIVQQRRVVDAGMSACLEKLLQRRLAREPLQYIIGHREFWSLDFLVSPAVLIPRPETEFLLDRVVNAVRSGGIPAGPVMDMCTGSGAIAVVLSLELAREIVAVDLSIPALAVAAANIRRHDRTGSISLLCSDLFAAIMPGPRFACCVANPPYIAIEDQTLLQPEVRDWEPPSALFAGKGGLDIISRLARVMPDYLQPGGLVFLEIGADQGEAVYSLFTVENHAAYAEVEVLADWSGRSRVLQARIKG